MSFAWKTEQVCDHEVGVSNNYGLVGIIVETDMRLLENF